MKITDLRQINMKEFSDQIFVEEAFAEYLDSKAEDYSNLCAALSEADSYPEDYSVSSILSKYGLSEKQLVLTDYGFVYVTHLMNTLYHQAEAEVEPNSWPNVEEWKLDIRDACGNALGKTILANDAAENILAQLTSTVALSSAIKAAKIEGDVSSKLALFSESVSSAVSEAAGANLTSSIAYARNLLTMNCSPSEIIVTLGETSGVLPLAEQTEEEPANGDLTGYNMTKYMGASPAGPLCFDNVKSAVQAVGKVGATIFKSIFTLAKKAIRTGVDKVCQIVKQVVSDPDDLQPLISNVTDNTIASGCWSFTSPLTAIQTIPEEYIRSMEPYFPKFPDGFNRNIESQREALKQTFYEYMDPYLGLAAKRLNKEDYIEMRFPFAIVRVKTVGLTPVLGVNWVPRYGTYYLEVSFGFESLDNYLDIEVYPRICSRSALKLVNLDLFDENNASMAITADQFLNRLTYLADSPNLYDVDGMSEIDKYVSLWTSLAIMGSFRLADAEFAAIGSTTNGSLPTTNASKVTNREFAEMATGYILRDEEEGTSSRPETEDVENHYYPITMSQMLKFVGTALGAVAWQFYERAVTPLDWGFVAFSRSGLGTPQAKFKIRTDKENINIFQTAGQTLVIVATVVATAVIIGVGAKKLRRSLALKRDRTIAMARAKLNRGENLTKKEWRQFRRANKKGGISSLYDQTLPSGSNPPEPEQFPSDELFSLLRGPVE